MKLREFETLKKMLERTFSENDHECLVAIRKANELLRRDDLTWTRILSKTVTIAADDVEEDPDDPSRAAVKERERPASWGPPKSDRERQKAEDAELIEEVVERTIGWKCAPFVASVEQAFALKGFMTSKQRAAFKKLRGDED